ncbi:unnamed protein product, partial [Soboliphyme baturini]|uniref:Sugar transporter SWEET1 n=1 Tax=Soboliphyme baturini TaxID=241478 RepID=A0A183ISF9_9BILA
VQLLAICVRDLVWCKTKGEEVFRTKSTRSLPFPLCVAGLAVSSQWFYYGVLVDDIFIKIPNAIGIILSLLQLSLFVIFRERIHAT